MKKFHCIIGRGLDSEEGKKYTWELDVDLGESRKISRQHALIAYNFSIGTFEIRCISKKGYVKVNSSVIYSYDKPIELKNRAYVTVGSENFYFLLPTVTTEEETESNKKIHI